MVSGSDDPGGAQNLRRALDLSQIDLANWTHIGRRRLYGGAGCGWDVFKDLDFETMETQPGSYKGKPVLSPHGTELNLDISERFGALYGDACASQLRSIPAPEARRTLNVAVLRRAEQGVGVHGLAAAMQPDLAASTEANDAGSSVLDVGWFRSWASSSCPLAAQSSLARSRPVGRDVDGHPMQFRRADHAHTARGTNGPRRLWRSLWRPDFRWSVAVG